MIKRVVGGHIFGQFKKREMIYFSQKKKTQCDRDS
jgi:hypothetical protein